MGQLTSHRRTVLLALGLVALAAVVAAPGAAQTERANISIDSQTDYVLVLNETGQTTMQSRNATGVNLTTVTENISDMQYALSPNETRQSGVERTVIRSERAGVSVYSGTITQQSETSADNRLRFETDISDDNTATVFSGANVTNSNPIASLTDIDTSVSDTTVETDLNQSADHSNLYVLSTNASSNQNPELVQEFYNQTISPGEAVNSLRVVNTNEVTVERARVRIISESGKVLVNDSMNSAGTVVTYGPVSLDDTDEYRITVTGVEKGTTPTYGIRKLKSNSPIISIGPLSDSNNTLLWVVLGLVGLALFLRTRD